MGMSASADLGFGVALGDEVKLVFWDRDDEDYSDETVELQDFIESELDAYDIAEVLAVRQLLTEGKIDIEDSDGTFELYRERKTEIEKKYDDKFPVEVMTGGTYEYSTDALVLSDKRYQAHTYWGAEAVKFDVPTQEDIDAAVEFCKEFNLPDFSEATWVLSAHYG